MKLHSDIIRAPKILLAAAEARATHHQDIQIGELVEAGSRKRLYASTFKGYSLSGRYATNSGVYGADHARAASWSAWGYLIAELFRIDPEAIIGQYDGAEDFERQCRQEAARRETYPDARYRNHPEDFEIGFLDIVRKECV